MNTIPVRQAVLETVIFKRGGIHPAAVALRVDPLIVGLYIDGAVPVPDDVLLRAVDIVFADSTQVPLPASGPA